MRTKGLQHISLSRHQYERKYHPNCERALRAAILVLCGWFLAVESCTAVPIYPGDILVADSDAGSVIRVNPLTGGQAVVASGGSLVSPFGIALATNGNLFVSDLNANNGQGGVYEINPVTGLQTLLSLGGLPAGIATDTNGDVLVAITGGLGGLVRIHPATATQSGITAFGFISQIMSVTVSSNGTIYVTSGYGSIDLVQVDGNTGAQTAVSSNQNARLPVGVAVANDGEIYLADINMAGGNGGVLHCDPFTGQQTLVASGGIFRNPYGIAVDVNGKLLVSDRAAAAIVRVDPVTGDQTIVSTNVFLRTPNQIALVPGVAQAGEESNHVPPTVSVLLPNDGVIFPADTNLVVTIAASAVAHDGSAVSKLSFFVDGSVVGETTSNPGTISLANPALGAHSITAIATDTLLASNASAVSTFTVRLTNAPTVNVLRPASGMLYPPNTNLTIALVASAAANDGAVISNIEFLVDGSIIGETAANPGTNYFVHPTVGQHNIMAIAIDTYMQASTSAVTTITIGAANSPLGDWAVTVSGSDAGAEFLTFDDDFNANGFGFRKKTMGLDHVSGHWNFNAKGQVTGPFIEELSSATNWAGTFLGMAKYRKSFSGAVATDAGAFHWKAAPLSTVPDVSGTWTGMITVAGTSTGVSCIISPNADHSGVFDISTNGNPATAIGQILVTPRLKVFGYLEFQGRTASVSGTFNGGKSLVTVGGKDQDAGRFTLKISRH